MGEDITLEVKKHDVKVSTLVFMIFCICAAGAYGIEAMIPSCGPGLTLVLLMVIPFVWGMPMAFASVELGAARPVEGGFYKWIQEALGEFWGFQAGWWKTIANFIDSSVYVILAGTYFALMTGASDMQRYAFQVIIIFIFVFINLRGVHESGKISTIIGTCILLVFGLITVVGFLNVKMNPFTPFMPPGQDALTSIGAGIAIGIWMYSGYEAMSAISGEVSNPKVIPKATLIAVPLIAATYILPTAASLASIGQWESWQEGITDEVVGYGTVLSTYLEHSIWFIVFGVVAVLAQCSIYNTWMAAGTRVLFALSDDNLAPKFINKVNKKHGVPYIPILIMAAVNLILCSFEFTVVLVIEVLLIIATQILLFITMLVMRKRIPDSERPLKIPGPKLFISIFFTLPIIVGVIAYLLNGTDYFLGGLIGLISGPIAYFIFKRKYGGLYKINPENNPINDTTKMAKGDLYRIAGFFVVVCILALLGSLFLPWYEGSWGPEYYLETYGADIFVSLLNGIKAFAIGGGILAVVFWIIAKKLEHSEEKRGI
ncbi:APC family permease [Anaerovorax odorimutans]|uniref:APC family permease n=1 Tax=Anaerovorax odorimutans TaxID=109327 RepID=UPI00041D0984|nr:APC family permease [Anaerovorax odorimutans]